MSTEFLLLLSVLLIFLGCHSLRNPPRGSPPGPRPLPLLGNLLLLGELPHRSLAELARRHGALMSLRLGLVPYLVVSSPTAAKLVLQKHDHVLSHRAPPDATRALNHDKLSMVHLPPGAAWRTLRKICSSHIFAKQRLDDNQHFRSEKVRELVSFLEKNAIAGKVVDVGRAAFTTSLNLISTTIFSEDMVRYDEESSADFKELVREIMVECASPNLADFFPLLRWLDPQGRRRRLTRHMQKMEDIFEGKIDNRQRSRFSEAKTELEDFLDVLLDAKALRELDSPTIKALLVDLFSAGSDTSSTTVEWAMTELLRSPAAMEKVRREVSETVEGSGKIMVEESDVGRMTYLQAIVKETLRLHPPAPFLIPRRAAETVEIEADRDEESTGSHYTIPAGTRVLVNAWAIGRDRLTWGLDADVFRPERFGADECSNVDFRGHYMELIPFGAGRRICPGLPLATRMVPLILANLLWFFDWKLPEGTAPADVSMAENFGITLCKSEPLLAFPVLAQKVVQ